MLDHRGYDINQMYVDILADFLNLVAGGQSRVAAALQAGLRAIEVCCRAESDRIRQRPQYRELGIMTDRPRAAEQLFGLDGQVAVVAGGAGRIGSAVSAGLAEAGAKVCVLDMAYEAAARWPRDWPPHGEARSIAVKADATQKAELESAFRRSPQRLGPPDHPGELDAVSRQGLLQLRCLRLPKGSLGKRDGRQSTGVLLACQVFGRAMIAHGRGSIVNLSSTYGVVSADPRIYGDSGVNSPVSYAASKAAVINLSRYLAIHWREKTSE